MKKPGEVYDRSDCLSSIHISENDFIEDYADNARIIDLAGSHVTAYCKTGLTIHYIVEKE